MVRCVNCKSFSSNQYKCGKNLKILTPTNLVYEGKATPTSKRPTYLNNHKCKGFEPKCLATKK